MKDLKGEERSVVKLSVYSTHYYPIRFCLELATNDFNATAELPMKVAVQWILGKQ